MKPLQNTDVERIMSAKQILEVEIAKALRRHFRKYFTYTLRKMIVELMEEILTVPEVTLNFAICGNQGCRDLLVWKRRALLPSHYGLRRLQKSSAQWTLDDFSDIIRLFGELAEVLPRDLGSWAAHNKGKSALRPQPTFVQADKSKSIKQGGWGEKFGHRNRSQLPADKRVLREGPYTDIRSLSGRPFPMPYQSLIRGVERFKFESGSVIAAMDKTFGLKPEGGDVSGTTTDSIYALRLKGGAAGVNTATLNALQLLPIVTMVSQGHHSLIECAYPLSRYKYMDYHIGYYKTLVPQRASATIKRDLEKILDPYEKDQRNKRVLVWGGGVQKRGVLMEGGEVDEFKRMSRVLSAYGFCVTGGLKDFKEALNVVKTFCPGLVAKLSSLEEEVGLSELDRAFKKRGLK